MGQLKKQPIALSDGLYCFYILWITVLCVVAVKSAGTLPLERQPSYHNPL